MNGEEKEIKSYSTPTKSLELTSADKMNLTLLAGMPAYESLKKLMEVEVITARDYALALSPAKREERNAAMDIAHAMALFCNYVQKQIEYALTQHMGEIREAAAKEAAQDQSFIESVILSQ